MPFPTFLHEINTPTQYAGDNTRFIQQSFQTLQRTYFLYTDLLDKVKKGTVTPDLISNLEETKKADDVEYLFQETPEAISQTLIGIDRISKIVNAMKEFSHPGGKEKSPADLNRAIETTVTVARNEWKYVADVSLDLDPNLPRVTWFHTKCLKWLAMKFMYRRKKRLEREAIEEQQRQEEMERQRLEEERAAAIAAGEVDSDELTEEEQMQLTERQTIEELIRTKPAEVALLIKSWLSED